MEAEGLIPGLLRGPASAAGSVLGRGKSASCAGRQLPGGEDAPGERGRGTAPQSHNPGEEALPSRALRPPAFLAHFKGSARVESVAVYVFFLCQSCWVSLLNVI